MEGEGNEGICGGDGEGVCCLEGWLVSFLTGKIHGWLLRRDRFVLRDPLNDESRKCEIS